MGLPAGARYVIIGAGIHGLSTAWNLARDLKSSGRGSGDDVVVIDKTGVGAGASGIACGVVRNNYFQPAMRELMAQCVEVWESDPESLQLITRSATCRSARNRCAKTWHDDTTPSSKRTSATILDVCRGRGGLPWRYMKTHVRRLAGQGHHLRAAREEAAATPTTRRRSTASPAKGGGLGRRGSCPGSTVTGFKTGHNSDAVTAVRDRARAPDRMRTGRGRRPGPGFSKVWNHAGAAVHSGRDHQGPRWPPLHRGHSHVDATWCLEEGTLEGDAARPAEDQRRERCRR